MKNRNKTKLGLDKLRIAKLENPRYIVGGDKGTTISSRACNKTTEAEGGGRDRGGKGKADQYKSEGDCP